MESRFKDGEVEKCGLLLLVLACVIDPKFRHKRDELKSAIKRCAKRYADDMGTDIIKLDTELELWTDFW